MTSSSYTLIGLALCTVIVIALCVLMIRRLARVDLSAPPAADDEDDVLELHQLSFDQVTDPDAASRDKARHNRPPEPHPPMPSATPATRQTTGLAEVDFGVRPDELVIDGLRPRLECTMALLNQTKTTLISIRISSDLLIYDATENQALRPSGPTMRQDTVARLDPGEKIHIHGDWKLPEGLLAAMSEPAGQGVYLLSRVRILGANVAPKSQFFIFGHLLENSRLVRLRNVPEAFTNLGVADARAE